SPTVARQCDDSEILPLRLTNPPRRPYRSPRRARGGEPQPVLLRATGTRCPGGRSGLDDGGNMNGRIPARIVRLAGTLLAAMVVGVAAAGSASAETVYSNIPAKPIGNYLSVSFEATLTSQFGGEVELAGTARSKPTVTVMMSSWACQTGSVDEQNCSTPKPRKTFKVPLTV